MTDLFLPFYDSESNGTGIDNEYWSDGSCTSYEEVTDTPEVAYFKRPFGCDFEKWINNNNNRFIN